MITTLKSWIDTFIWGERLQKYGVPGRIVMSILRHAYAVLRDIFSGQLTLRAMSLVYTTLLSVVPLIAVRLEDVIRNHFSTRLMVTTPSSFHPLSAPRGVPGPVDWHL